MKGVRLKPGRERSLLRRHPWVFSNAIARLERTPAAGDTVDVLSADGKWLARGAYSPRSQIAVRIWTFDPAQEVDTAFFRSRLERAWGSRGPTARVAERAGRIVNAESDGLPGVVVDRYADFLVCQFTSAGAERGKTELSAALAELVPATGIYERSDVDVRAKEELAPATGMLRGQAPPDRIPIVEGSCRFLVDVRHGHKTGFYLDQAQNRSRLRAYCEGAEVLDGFAYTAACGITALAAGATRVTAIESSAEAIALARENLAANGIDPARLELIAGDAFEVLRRLRDAARRFDLIVLDPPKFAAARSQLARAARGYKDINLLAFKLLRRGGVLVSFSCSGLMTPELFQKIVADAALDAGCEAQIIERLTQAPDHPVALSFPEGGYLKGLVCRVL